MTTSQTKKENHALNNAIGHIKSMVEDYETGSYIEQCNPTSQDQEEKLEEIKKKVLLILLYLLNLGVVGILHYTIE